MEGYHHNLNPDTWVKIFTYWFTKYPHGYINFHLVKIHQFSTPLGLILTIHRICSLPNILFPRSREQDDYHSILYFISSCLKLH